MYFYKSKQDWIPERLEYILYGFMPQGNYSLLRQEITNTFLPLQKYINLNIVLWLLSFSWYAELM